MRKFASILLLLVYMSSNTECHELLKLPMLISHFSEHKEREFNLSFVRFLSMHYLHGNPKDADYARDMKLPFKDACHHYNTLSSSYCPLTATDENLRKITPPSEGNRKVVPYSSCHYAFSLVSSIWQPPKTC